MTTREILQQLNEGFKQTLPSGLTVMIRRISLESYKRNGKIPTHLQGIVADVRNKGTGKVYQDAPDDAQTFFEWVICEALLDPQVTIDGADGTVPLDYLSDADQTAIYRAAFGDISKAIEAIRPLSKRKRESGSSTSTPLPSDTDSAPAA